MAQDIFPKADGEIFFASEANRFAGAGRFIEIGSTQLLGSQTGVSKIWGNGTIDNYSEHGSVFLSGTLATTNPCEVNIMWRTEKETNTRCVIAISGLENNLHVMFNGSVTDDQGNGFNAQTRMVLGSPFSGLCMSILWDSSVTDDVNGNSTNILTSFRHAGQIAPINTGSPWVIFFGAGSNTGNSIYHYSIQSFRAEVGAGAG